MSTGRNSHSLITHSTVKHTGAEHLLLVRQCSNGHVTKRLALAPCPICEAHLSLSGSKKERKQSS